MTYEELQNLEGKTLAEAKASEIASRLELPLTYTDDKNREIKINSVKTDGDQISLEIEVKGVDVASFNPFVFQNPPVNVENADETVTYDPIGAIKVALSQTLNIVLGGAT